MLVGGIDEARRGPVIGPMTICLALATRENEEKLRVMGVKDSKLLTPAQRERLAVEIRKLCKIHLAKVTAKHLNEQMKLKSLNAIEADYMTELIKGIPKKDWGELELIYIDVPDPIPLKFVQRLGLPKKAKEKIHASHKAERFPIVAAASIIAKVTGDAELKKIEKELGCDLGSGYPHDPVTIKCLEENIHNPIMKKYLRTAWSTTKEMIKRLSFKTKQVKLDDF